MRRNDINLLRNLIREIVNEGQVPSSDIVFYQSPASSFKRIQLPGAAALKTIGVLYAVSWLKDYVGQDCMTSFDSLGMPIPQATKKFAAYSAVSIPADATNVPGLKAQQQGLANDWAIAIKKDINMTPDPSGTEFEQLGGLIPLFQYISANFTSDPKIWPRDAKELTQIAGHNAALTDTSTNYYKLLTFVKTLLNSQCAGAVNDQTADKLIKDQFKKRSQFISFVKTYTDTMGKDYLARKDEQLGKIESDGYKMDAKTTKAINDALTAYQASLYSII